MAVVLICVDDLLQNFLQFFNVSGIETSGNPVHQFLGDDTLIGLFHGERENMIVIPSFTANDLSRLAIHQAVGIGRENLTVNGDLPIDIAKQIKFI